MITVNIFHRLWSNLDINIIVEMPNNEFQTVAS